MQKKRNPSKQPVIVESPERDLAVNDAAHRFFERVERLVLVAADDTQKCREVIAAGALWRTVIMLTHADRAGHADVFPLLLGRDTGIAATLADLMAIDMIASSVDVDADELLATQSNMILTAASGLAALAIRHHLGFDAAKTPA